jgi:hypothetical protein
LLRSLPVRGALILVCALLFVPASAHAAQITGNPLSISSADEDGRLGVAFTGSQNGEFFGSFVDPQTGEVRPASNAGFVVVTVDPRGNLNSYGSRRSNVTPTGAPVVTGDGSPGSPFRIQQTFKGGNEIEIDQVLTYVNGETSFRATATVRNLTTTQLQMRVSMGADLAGGGDDRGTGLFEQGPPRFAGGFNNTVGSVAGLFEISPWSHFEEGQYGDVLLRADADPRSDSLRDTVDPNEVDNGAAVQWDAPAVGPGGAVSYDVGWRFTRTFDLDPETANLTTGDIGAFTVKLRNTAGQPLPRIPIRWASVGINNSSGATTTGGDGSATFEIIGANPGSDRLTVYADLNNNNQRDDGEPQREAQVNWTGLEAPTFAQEVNLKPVDGTVRVRVPRNARVKGKWAHAAQSSFVKLDQVRQVPVGAELDTRAGRVQLTSSVNKGGTTVQTSHFYSGRFTVTQRSRDRGVTEIRLSEPLKCQPNTRAGKVVAAASRSRRLWGRGRGRFRTRGRHSSATVRGTAWLTKDTCTTTTTSVREGVVVVKDFAKRKNVRVKAPRRYVARARRR